MTRDGKVHRNSGDDLSGCEYYKKAKSVEGKKQFSALKGNRDDEIIRKQLDAHSHQARNRAGRYTGVCCRWDCSRVTGKPEDIAAQKSASRISHRSPQKPV